MSQRISRRTVLRGLGTALALPLLEAMRRSPRWRAPAATAPPLRHGLPLRPQRRPHARLDAEGRRRRLRAARRSSSRWSPSRTTCSVLTGLAQDNGAGQRRRPRRPRPRRRHASSPACHPRKTDGADIQVGRLGRPGRRQQIGQPDPVRLARAGLRRGRAGGQLRLGLQLRLLVEHLLAAPTTPLAKEINPRLVFERLFGDPKPDVRPERDRREAGDVPPERPRLRARRRQAARRRARRWPTAASSTNTSTASARSRSGSQAAEQDDAPTLPEHARRRPASPREFPRAHPPDVRPDGARLPDRLDAGRDLRAGQRGQRTSTLSRSSACPRATTSSRTTAATPEKLDEDPEDQPVPRRAVRLLRSRS